MGIGTERRGAHQGSFRGRTHGNAVPIVENLTEVSE